MSSSVRTLLLAAALTYSCASFAQDKPPVPKEAPPRVPFSAFRMKPILDSQLEKKSGSLVVQDMDKPYKPTGEMHVLKPKVSTTTPSGKAKIVPLALPPKQAAEVQKKKEAALQAVREQEQALKGKAGLPPHIEEIPTKNAKPVTVTKLVKPIPMPKPVTLPEGQPPQKTAVEKIDNPPEEDIGIAAPKPVPLEELVELDKLTAVFVKGIPIPAPKPTGRQIVREGGREATENILATPSEGSLPKPPVSEGVVNMENRAQASADIAAQTINPIIAAPKPVAPDDVYVPVPKGGATERIRDRRRFGSQERMAGEGAGLAGGERSPSRLASLGLPPDMKNLRIGKLEDAEGISPVLIPGHTEIVAAPDADRMDKRGLPAEVIVFFQENSREMEIGQMDVIASDVLARLKDRPDLDLEIVGYSEPLKDGDGATDKMALARALMIRDYLSRQRIADNRLTVKSEGDDTGIEPRDRVEMYFSR